MPSDDPERPATAREELLEFETLISGLSSRFVNLAPDEVDQEIEDALRRLCEPLAIDLAVLWQWSAVAPDRIVPTHAYPPLKEVQSLRPLRCRAPELLRN